jgi:hypothetical protein
MNLFRYLHFDNIQRGSFLSAMLHLWAKVAIR